MKKQKENVDFVTGEILDQPVGKLNEVIVTEYRRPDGSLRVQYNFDNCPTMAEQHTAHLTDINHLMATYKPDELAQYISARNNHRQEITGWDFSAEPDPTSARNTAYNLKMAFEKLDPDVKRNFQNHLEFLKFIDNPANQEKMLKLGLMTKREIQNNATPTTDPTPKPATPPLSPTTTS